MEAAVAARRQEFYAYVGDSVAQNGVPSTPDNDQMAMYQDFANIELTTDVDGRVA